MDEVKPAARLPTVEHREPCKSRGSRTVLGAPGGEIPPGNSSETEVPRRPRFGRYRGLSGPKADIAEATLLTPFRKSPGSLVTCA